MHMKALRSRSARHVNLADVIDPITKHREALEAIPHSDGRVDTGVAPNMTHNLVGEDAPGHHFDPSAVVLDFQLPRLRAHGVLRGHDLDGATGKQSLDRLKHLCGHLP